MAINIGISENNRKNVTDELSKLLADSYALYLKTQNFHWNVTGSMFQVFHTMFEQQYTELSLSVDVIAERIRALGFNAPATFAEFSRLTSIKDSGSTPSSSREMIHQLMEGHETIVRNARSAFSVTNNASDEVSSDLLTQCMQSHEKTAWILRSMLEG